MTLKCLEQNYLISAIKKLTNNNNILNYEVLGLFVIVSLLMYMRVFFGTEITDEAYYVAEAKEILMGGFIPYANNDWSQTEGFTFILIPIEYLFSLFSPDFEGVFLFTRLCFVTFKIAIALCVYRILSRRHSHSTALLLAVLLVPMTILIQNFSYNTVPELTLFLSACLVYDVIEQDMSHKKIRLILAGLLTALGCFANPGWGAALIVLSVLIYLRSSPKERKANILYYLTSVFCFVLMVVLWISALTSFSDLCYGFYRIFISRFPTESMNPEKSYLGIIKSFLKPTYLFVIIFVLSYFIIHFFSNKYVFDNGKKLTSKHVIELSFICALFFIVFLECFRRKGDYELVQYIGLISCLTFIAMIFSKNFRKEIILWYLCLFQPIYVVLVNIMQDQGAGLNRFVNTFTLVIPVLFVLSKSTFVPVKKIVAVTALIIVMSFVYTNYNWVYRDEGIRHLTHRVHSGVYKGIFTTEQRAHDLPELENYLNIIIDDSETYAFRDNVPSAYLMTHKKNVCELATWDVLQYSYHLNSPALLFDYYRITNKIPDKIIYIDYGRDKNLSIDDPSFKYNQWVESYYELIDDVEFNKTYFRIKVFKYKGNFDGNFQRWIAL